MHGLQKTSKVILFFSLFSSVAIAADFSLPGAVQPGVVGQQIAGQQPGQTTSRQYVPVMGAQPSQSSLLNSKVKKITFRLDSIVLKGNTVYPTSQLEFIYKDKLHKTISVADAFDIVQKITNYYRNNGYIISRAILPPQKIDKGVMIIQIIEGYIGDIKVVGCPRGSYCIVQIFGNKMKQCRPLLLSRLERYLTLVNEIPGTTVKAEFAPSKLTSGAADLSLITTAVPIMGYLSYDNYGTRYLGPQQMTGNLAVNSVLLSGDSLQGTYVKTPRGRELTYFDLNYNAPVDDEGTRLLLGWTKVSTHPEFVLAPAKLDGTNDNFYATLYFPTLRTRTESMTWRLGFNYLDSGVTTLGVRLYMDHLRPLDLGFTWNFSDAYMGSNVFSGDLRQGLPILGYTSDINPVTADTSRPGGRGDFTKLAGSVNRTQLIPDSNFSLFGVLQGQWAFNPLLSAEQFAYGGPVIGRGYDVAELIGDRGLAGSLELRYSMTFKRMVQSMQFYAFYDAGIIWNLKFVGGVPRQQSATSAGLGTRFYFTKWFSGNFFWAQPLTKYVAAEQIIGRGWRPRVFFSVTANF